MYPIKLQKTGMLTIQKVTVADCELINKMAGEVFLMQQKHDAVFKHAFSHLGFYIVYFHCSFSFEWHKYMYYFSTLHCKVL